MANGILKGKVMENVFDIIIIGAGPAGLTAALYAKRAGANVTVFEGASLGGQASLSAKVENFPGIDNITGADLVERMETQVTNLGVEIKYNPVIKIEKVSKGYIVHTKSCTYQARKLILSMGARARTLGVPGEVELLGRGVCYCAVCDGGLYKGRDVVVVGGGDSAVEDALYLSNICKSVTLIVRKELSCAKAYLDKLDDAKRAGKINVVFGIVTKILGDGAVESVVVGKDTIKTSAVFIAIGRIPDSDIVRDLVECDSLGYVKTDSDMRTSDKNIFACGDIRKKSVRQIVTACADGAIAGTFASKK